MCGGLGSRLDSEVEKPLVTIKGTPMVDRVLEALQRSCVDQVYAVVSPQAPETRSHLSDELSCIETPGNGYVADLQIALDEGPVDPPVLTSVADLPLLGPDPVDRLIEAARRGGSGGDSSVRSTTAVVPVALKRELGISIDGTATWIPAGVNVVTPVDNERADGSTNSEAASDGLYRSWDVRLAVNVNRRRDIQIAQRLAAVEVG